MQNIKSFFIAMSLFYIEIFFCQLDKYFQYQMILKALDQLLFQELILIPPCLINLLPSDMLAIILVFFRRLTNKI